MSKKCPISAQLVIPASFAECLTYEKQIQWLKREIDSISTGVEPAISLLILMATHGLGHSEYPLPTPNGCLPIPPLTYIIY